MLHTTDRCLCSTVPFPEAVETFATDMSALPDISAACSALSVSCLLSGKRTLQLLSNTFLSSFANLFYVITSELSNFMKAGMNIMHLETT
jgi:hypothetical protein